MSLDLKKEKRSLETFRVSPEWRRVRRDFLKLYPRCEACGGKQRLEAHHIIPVHLKPSLELDVNNLITLCELHSHHLTFGHKMSYRSWNRTVREDAKNYRESVKTRPKPWELEEETNDLG